MIATKQTELLPCPLQFCGGPVQFHKDDDCAGCHLIECQSCKTLFDLATKADPYNQSDSLEELQGGIAYLWNLRAQSAPEPVQGEALDQRLEAAGMLSVAKLLQGAPLDAFIKHAGVNDLDSLLQWAEMRRGECLRMMARYDLGEKDKGDDLYEWTVAHCAVFTELHVNLRAALTQHNRITAAAKPDAELVALLAEVRKRCQLPDWARIRIDAKLAEQEKTN